jgi:hypothetical protein
MARRRRRLRIDWDQLAVIIQRIMELALLAERVRKGL